jgi:rhodanese-related sulfurtransferase
MAGFVAAGLLRGDHPQIDVETLLDGDRPATLLLDVRAIEEFAAGHIPGAINIPIDELRSRLDELPRDAAIITYCQVGQRGYLATRILRQRGFNAANLGGGYVTYRLWHPQPRAPTASS